MLRRIRGECHPIDASSRIRLWAGRVTNDFDVKRRKWTVVTSKLLKGIALAGAMTVLSSTAYADDPVPVTISPKASATVPETSAKAAVRSAVLRHVNTGEACET